MYTRANIVAAARAVAVLSLFFSVSVSAGILPSPADQFVILGIGGPSAAARGTVIINSATKIFGDVGYNQFTTSTTNQKVDTFTGTAYVHSEVAPGGVTGPFWDYAAATYVPSGGIKYGSSNAAVDTLLSSARAAALSSATIYGGLPATQTIPSINDTSVIIPSTGNVNVIDIGLMNANSDTITLSGRPGFTDTFVLRTTGSFDFSQSTVAMVNTDVAHVLWYFPTPGSHILVNKADTVFNGTILAPFTTDAEPVTYHNPATFNGQIIAKDINVHSDFNIVIPEPAGLGCVVLCLTSMIRRRSRAVDTRGGCLV